MKTTAQPVMAINPYTEKLMNVEPVFHLINTFSSTQDCYAFTDDAIKIMALSHMPEWADLETKGNVVMFLYEMRDLFSRLNECEISIPKKKGAIQ